jgi:hypothetical protein
MCVVHRLLLVGQLCEKENIVNFTTATFMGNGLLAAEDECGGEEPVTLHPPQNILLADYSGWVGVQGLKLELDWRYLPADGVAEAALSARGHAYLTCLALPGVSAVGELRAIAPVHERMRAVAEKYHHERAFELYNYDPRPLLAVVFEPPVTVGGRVEYDLDAHLAGGRALHALAEKFFVEFFAARQAQAFPGRPA